MTQLIIDRVSKSFGMTEVLKEVSIDIDEGELIVLVGPSGCGKSTLLNMIAGLLNPSGGEIRLDGDRIDNQEPKDRNIAMVFQSYALYPSMTVEKNMAFPLRMAGVPKAEQTATVNDVAELLQIGHLLKRKPAALSGGQRQRVAMGRALVRDPKLFLFDEPLSNLDAKLRVDMRTEIKLLHQRLGKTMVYVTHDQVEAMTMASRIAVMEGGLIQQLGTPAEIYDRPANTFVATFMGSPAMNLIPAEGGADASAIKIGDQSLPLSQIAAPPSAGQSVMLGLRPEWINLEGRGAPLRATAELIEPTGPDVYASLRVNGERVMARLPAGVDIALGTEQNFHVTLEKAPIFDAQSGAALYANT
jgi:multiple sugar transport system ATP-binding protein